MLSKFNKDESGLFYIRYEVLKSTKLIAFCITLTDLVQFNINGNFDPDAESENIITQNQGADKNLAFQYVINAGFVKVNTAEQNWFKFPL